jgi:hypothetical protein
MGAAVYFALHSFSHVPGAEVVPDSSDPPCLWLLNPYELNKQSWGVNDLVDPRNLGWDEAKGEYYSYSELLLEGGVDWEPPVAIYPKQRTTRMQVQRGWFTIHGDDFRPLEAFKQAKKCVRAVPIPIDAIAAAHAFLMSAGMELFTLFPDLPSLAVHLSRQLNAERSAFSSRNGTAPGSRAGAVQRRTQSRARRKK